MSRRTIRSVGGGVWLLVALVASTGVAQAQPQRESTRLLAEFGRMDRSTAREIVDAVSETLRADVALGGVTYTPVRRAVAEVVLGTGPGGGPGATREEWERRLGRVLDRMRAGLDAQLLRGVFSERPNAAVLCAASFSLSMAACDALIAAAAGRPAAIDYFPPDDGSALRDALVEGGAAPRSAGQVATGLVATMVGVPGILNDSPRGRALVALLEACPGGLSGRESQVRAWHVGPTVGMARCLAEAAIGRRSPRDAVAFAANVFGLSEEAARTFVGWVRPLPVASASVALPRPAPSPATPPLAPEPRPSAPPVAPSAIPTPASPTAAPPGGSPLEVARAHFSARRFAEAAAAYEAEAARTSPPSTVALAGLGASALALGDARRAIRAYDAAIRGAPNESALYVGIGRAFLGANEPANAQRAFQHALSLDPSSAGAREGLARLAPAASGPPVAASPSTTPSAFAAAPPPGMASPATAAAPASASGLPDAPPRESIIAALRPLSDDVHQCLPGVTGVVTVGLVIDGATGTVRGANVQGEHATLPGAECVTTAVLNATFPRFARETLSIAYPFSL